jgi:hypothetical protein
VSRARATSYFCVNTRPRNQDRGGGAGAAASAVKSRLGLNRDARHTIEARRRAASVDNHRNRDDCDRRGDYRSRHHDDRGRGGRYDNDDDRSWSPNQRGLRAFSQGVRDARVPPRFQALTNVSRYDGDTNSRVWLEDYRLACHAGGATNNVFIIKNLLLYLGDSAQTWLKHLPCDKIND